jgi:hypothetical protein
MGDGGSGVSGNAGTRSDPWPESRRGERRCTNDPATVQRRLSGQPHDPLGSDVQLPRLPLKLGASTSSRPARSARGPSAWGPSTSKSARCRATAKSASRSPPTTRPTSWRSKASSGRFPHASPMPWTPFQREPGSRTRSSSNSGSGPPAGASRRATGPGRRGRQPPEAQGTAGAIGPRPAERSYLQPGLARDCREGVADGAPTGAAGVGG